MHPNHPTMAEALNRAHIRDMHNAARVRPRGARVRRPHPTSTGVIRSRTGWFLVHVGLRLALPPRRYTTARMSPATR